MEVTRRRYGDATYLGTSLSEVAGLIAQDGDFDFTSLDSRKLEQLYAAGGWHRSSRARLPGIERLRGLIKAGELPYVAHVGWGVNGLVVLDTGQVVSITRNEHLLDLVICRASRRNGKNFKLSRLPVRHQRRVRREITSCRSGLLTWAWGYVGTTVIRSSRPHTFPDGRQEMPICGYMLPIRGMSRRFHPFLNRVGFGTEMPARENDVGLSKAITKVEGLSELMASQELGELAVLIQVEGEVMTLHPMNSHSYWAACKNSFEDVSLGLAMILMADVSGRSGRSPMLRRLRQEYGNEVIP